MHRRTWPSGVFLSAVEYPAGDPRAEEHGAEPGLVLPDLDDAAYRDPAQVRRLIADLAAAADILDELVTRA